MNTLRLSLLLVVFTLFSVILSAEDGYRLWLRYDKINNSELLKKYSEMIKYVIIPEGDEYSVIKNEIQNALKGLLNKKIEFTNKISESGALIIGTPQSNNLLNTSLNNTKLIELGEEGYFINNQNIEGKNCLVILSNKTIGSLYGVFHLIRLLETHTDITNLNITESPKIKHRILNHWDNLDRTVERGYAGFSIWNWHKLPDFIDQRYIDYARANASIGINGTVLTNVNANSLVLTERYIEKVAALADVFRPYGIKVYLTARFSSPIEIGGLKTADPINEEVKSWWINKVKEIYKAIPDFGGFLVKANSEGQPGPQNYERTHADGANMLADALAPHGGIVMWRAFVYTYNKNEDRAKQANNEFVPLDGKFRDNVLIQVKNGPIDFQPREPFHPLFGAMPKTSLALELQITQEYLGQGTQLVYLAPLYKECLESDTYTSGEGSTVAKIIDGSIHNHKHTAIAGVSNIGTDRNWTGHHFGQANWYAFGRLAWNHKITSEQIAEEWIKMTFCNNPDVVNTIIDIMMPSREYCVNYMTPLGLHHIMGWGHHYGPGPWINQGRPDWTSVYYHQADKNGIGFDRTSTGSDALNQYAPEIEKKFTDLNTCPVEYLLWFHHLSWDYKVPTGNTLWDELCYRYYSGVDSVKEMKKLWTDLENKIDEERFKHVQAHLTIQIKEAEWWRNACLLYFQSFSQKPIPKELPKPDKTLEYYKNLFFPYAPGIKPKW